MHDLALPEYQQYSYALRGLLAIGKQREFQGALRTRLVRNTRVNAIAVVWFP